MWTSEKLGFNFQHEKDIFVIHSIKTAESRPASLPFNGHRTLLPGATSPKQSNSRNTYTFIHCPHKCVELYLHFPIHHVMMAKQKDKTDVYVTYEKAILNH